MENIYLTEKQVAEKYQVSTKTLHNWRKAEILVEGIQSIGVLLRLMANTRGFIISCGPSTRGAT